MKKLYMKPLKTFPENSFSKTFREATCITETIIFFLKCFELFKMFFRVFLHQKPWVALQTLLGTANRD